jgi:Ni,Fe-hydrogenase maturation factor
MLAAHLGYTDTPMIAALDVPKNDPVVIVDATHTGLEAGTAEVLADETSRRIRAALAEPLGALYPSVAVPA